MRHSKRKNECDNHAARTLLPPLPEPLAFLAPHGLAAVFTDQFQTAHVQICQPSQTAIYPADSDTVRAWLTRTLFLEDGKVPPVGRVRNFINLLAAFAHEHRLELHNRSARSPDGTQVWIDLADGTGQVAHVTAKGWQVIRQAPVLFHHYPHQQPLPLPERHGSLEGLSPFLSRLPQSDRLLVICWLVLAFLADMPRPILLVLGPHGSGKTTLCRLLRQLTDPADADALGRDDRGDLPLTLRDHAVSIFDNLDALSVAETNIFCRAVTGLSLHRRRLFTDDRSFRASFRRAVMLDSLYLPSSRPDFLDRCLILDLERFAPEQRQRDHELNRRFQAARPTLFGGLLDVLSRTLANLDQVEQHHLSRLADFHLFGRVAAKALGHAPQDFDQAMAVALERQTQVALHDPLVQALVLFVQRMGQWQGEPQDLLKLLVATASNSGLKRGADWPPSPAALGHRLRHLKETLARFEVTIGRPPRADTRRIHIQYVGAPSVATVPTIAAAGSAPPGFFYTPKILSLKEQQALWAQCQALTFVPAKFRSQETKRLHCYFGYAYIAQRRGVLPTQPFPEFLTTLTKKCARYYRQHSRQDGQRPCDPPDMAIISRYPPGATIDWHTDADCFGEVIYGVSLGAEAVLQSRLRGQETPCFEQVVAPGSLYVMSGPARFEFQHRIPEVKVERISFTLRKVIRVLPPETNTTGK